MNCIVSLFLGKRRERRESPKDKIINIFRKAHLRNIGQRSRGRWGGNEVKAKNEIAALEIKVR